VLVLADCNDTGPGRCPNQKPTPRAIARSKKKNRERFINIYVPERDYAKEMAEKG
jgi:hypothetical protein